MRRVLVLCVALTLAVLAPVFTPSASAVEGPSVTVGDLDLLVGETGAVDITISTDGASVGSLSLQLLLDATVVAPVLDPATNQPVCTSDSASISLLICGPTDANSEVLVATIAITGFDDGATVALDVIGTGLGQAVLDLSVRTASDTAGSRIDVTAIDGTVTVSEEPEPETPTKFAELLEKLESRVPAKAFERLERIFADRV